MQNSDNISLAAIDAFINRCSQSANGDYEPYINYDFEPELLKSNRTLPLLENTGIELWKDKNTFSLYLTERSCGLIGCCTAFTYYDNDNILTHELSMLVDPMYRRHGLGRMLVMQMMLGIEAETKKNVENNPSDFIENAAFENEYNTDNLSSNAKEGCDIHILLTGNNEYFAESCGFSYSHSEHFMIREPYSQLDISQTATHYEYTVHDIPCANDNCHHSSEHPCIATTSSAITRTSHKSPGHHTYRLFCNGNSAAKCTVLECSDYVNIANVYTNKKFRGRRFAGQLINAVAIDFPQKKLLLQVSGSNTAAIHAYTRAGFTFYKTFDYYVATLM